MENRLYSIVYGNQKEHGKLWLQSPFTGEDRSDFLDITEYDFITSQFSKKEFAEKIKLENGLDLKDTDIFLMKFTSHGKLRTYEPIFTPETNASFYNSILDDFHKLIEERMEKVYQENAAILLDNSKTFQNLVYKLLKVILSNNECRLFVTRNSSFLYPLFLKDNLRKCITSSKLDEFLPFFFEYLRKYN